MKSYRAITKEINEKLIYCFYSKKKRRKLDNLYKDLEKLRHEVIETFKGFPYETYTFSKYWFINPGPCWDDIPKNNVIHFDGLTYCKGYFWITEKHSSYQQFSITNRDDLNRYIGIKSLDALCKNRYSKMLISNIDKIIYKKDKFCYGFAIKADIVFDYYGLKNEKH